MKKIILTISAFCISMVSLFAQESAGKPSRVPEVLASYYVVKDALVKTDAKQAAVAATDLLKLLNTLDKSALSTTDQAMILPVKEKLIAETRSISVSSDIEKQRQSFSGLSSDMVALVKSTKGSGAPTYVQYCPMKKATWLSKEPAVKNPYYGNAMLTCGKVTETIK
jgi:hypothetical protein